LGFLGAIIIGAGAGLIVDHSFITAFFAGFAGSAILIKLANQEIEKKDDDIKTGPICPTGENG